MRDLGSVANCHTTYGGANVHVVPINQDHISAFTAGIYAQSMSPLYAIKNSNDRRYTMDDEL